MRTQWLTMSLVLGMASIASAADEAKPVAPIELALSGETKYVLDTGTQTQAEFKKSLEATKGRPKIAPPAVSLVLKIKNTSDKPIYVWTVGDPVVLTLNLKGDGAVTLKPLLPMTREFRNPKVVEVAAGKTIELPLKSLTSGVRGISQFDYWTAPGEYTLSATLKTGVSPRPEGTQDMDGFGAVTVTSKPLTITVTEKK